MDTRTHVRTGKAESVPAKDKDMPFPTCHIDVGGIRVASYLERDDAAEIVRRYNAFPALVEALNGLVQSIEFQAEANFLNEDADEGEENALTRARQALKAAQQ